MSEQIEHDILLIYLTDSFSLIKLFKIISYLRFYLVNGHDSLQSGHNYLCFKDKPMHSLQYILKIISRKYIKIKY